ncbi:hypothetical protein L2E82_47969 [Cichorium intybus]|uniref:Uncharacterized protein n=1 Tax=Cichorium intybus TaxID=13427 RepID=A0ACB8Z150_CICIN|nr:hypothetical protein L2E82_47969 [Cichorium intybus]
MRIPPSQYRLALDLKVHRCRPATIKPTNHAMVTLISLRQFRREPESHAQQVLDEMPEANTTATLTCLRLYNVSPILLVPNLKL